MILHVTRIGLLERLVYMNKDTGSVPEVLTPQEAADLLRTNVASLAQLRYGGGGPHYVKLGRSVRYRRTDIQAFLDGNTYERTDKAVAL